MSRTLLRLGAAAALGMVAAPALATPDQDLARAFQNLQNRRYLEARDGARAYLQANGPRFSAAFIVAVAECQLHPHLRANAAPFRQLRIDYEVGSDKELTIFNWMKECASPPPPPPSQQAGVSGSALTVRPSIEVGRPAGNEPLSRQRRPAVTPPVTHPLPAPPIVATAPPVAPASPASDRCLPGFVWREAFAGDHVCVVPPVRAQVAEDNAAAAAHRDPAGAYGPNSCVAGLVWRQARPDDLVCVTPERRAQATRNNRDAAARRTP